MRKIIGVAFTLLVIGLIIDAANYKNGSSDPNLTSTTDATLLPAGTTSTSSSARPGGTHVSHATPYSGVAPNANYGPATDQSACPAAEVTVGPDTSCPFAHNVAAVVDRAHHATGHYPANVTAFSPVTAKTYHLTCSILGFGSELVCATAAPATGIVVMPLRATAAAPPPPPSEPAPAPATPATTQPASEGPGSFDHAGDGEFCSTHGCIANFPNGHGYVVECADGQWSHSGGLSGACSDYGGES